MEILKVPTESFKNKEELINSGYFEILLEKRNLLTLEYIFQNKIKEFFIGKGRVYINKDLQYVNNTEEESYLCVDYTYCNGETKSIKLCRFENSIRID